MKLFLLSIFLFFLHLITKAHFLYRQPPTANHQPPTVNSQPSTANRQPPTINRVAFYKAMEENNKDLVNVQLTELQSAPSEIRDAFMGAMLMKKAGFVAPPAIRVRLFKEGHKMLEAAIRQDPDNAEFHFLRLIIQEHAPGLLGYKNDLQKDSEFIRKSYKSLPDELQQVITNYSKKSKSLKLEVS
ncbi:MAG TPA: hypothetical protein VGZ90_11495 [Puia sp.]|jgi:hypothetical protein|nr:hypothetical protein [Puia sp.]